MRSSFPRIVAVAGLLVLVVLSSLAWAGPREISSGGAKIGENQSTEGFAASALTVDSGGGTVVATIPVGGNPAGVAYNSGNGYVYVTNPFSDIVSVINGTTVVATVPVEYNPSGVAYDSGNGYVYVANDTTYVSVINGTTVVATVPVGGEPNALAYDSENGYVNAAGGANGSATGNGAPVSSRRFRSNDCAISAPSRMNMRWPLGEYLASAAIPASRRRSFESRSPTYAVRSRASPPVTRKM